ncbi:hypothetical protein PGTUg99_021142 [Puccinia graminis f. sp. tritici]|uniref:C2H2-type domain-containing protein n=1 Tax=Puccinia graminis f. sp. tritici TaxID=56615 RepID=A0A5B0R4S6_PUCGR|nr:hypothetical protein PGTUg99_021142 [Puccinia graminis f. sp. tritici]
MRAMEPPAVEMPPYSAFERVFTSASSAQDAQYSQSTSRATIPIPEGFVAPTILPLGFEASNVDPFRPSLGIDSESSSQPQASYSYPLPTHQNGNSGSVPRPTHQNGNSGSAPLPVHSHTDPRLSLNYQTVAPVAGPSSLQPYSAPPLGANGNFNFSVPAVIPNGWHPDQATTENFLGYDSPAIPVAGPSSRPYSAPPPGASSRSASKKVAAKVFRSEKRNYLSNRRGNVTRLDEVGKKPFVCDVCGKIYKRSGDLQKHQREKHDAPAAKPRAKKPKVSEEKYPCKYAHEGCKKSYKSLEYWHYYNHLEKVHGEVVIVSEPVRREMVSTFPESEDEDDCEEHNPVPGPSREPSS